MKMFTTNQGNSNQIKSNISFWQKNMILEISSIQGGVGKWEVWCTTVRSVNWQRVFLQIKYALPFLPGISLLGVYRRETLLYVCGKAWTKTFFVLLFLIVKKCK